MKTAAFDYHLPGDLIAQRPLADRAASQLLVVRRDVGSLEHRMIRDLPDLLAEGSVLVTNDSRVIPARLLNALTWIGWKSNTRFLPRLALPCWKVRAARSASVGKT